MARKPQDPRERRLWKKAKKRAAFKKNLSSYVVVNIALLVLWVLTNDEPWRFNNFWPAWVLFGWGIALIFNFQAAYSQDTEESMEQEMERLREEEGAV